MKRVFEEICAITCDDAVEFDAATLVVEPILKEANYSGVHVKVFGYIERSRNLIEFDICAINTTPFIYFLELK